LDYAARCALSTSEYLRTQLRDLDKWTDAEADDETPPADAQLYELIRRIEVDSVESLLPIEAARIIQHPHHRKDLLADSLDDHYTRKFLEEIPGIVRRALKLQPLFVQDMISSPTGIYLREATRSYLFGLFQAAAALSRSALEHSLRESLRNSSSLLGETDELLGLIRAAERVKPRVLAGDALQFAHEVRKTATVVLHGKPCTEQDSFDLLVKTRAILNSVYG
jgi:hypothetical protein